MSKASAKPIKPLHTDSIRTFYWTEDALFVLDQRRLPLKEEYFRADSLEKVRKSIRDMLVRGAPAIGIVAAIGVYIAFRELSKKAVSKITKAYLDKYMKRVKDRLSSSRPTAVNLFWALSRMEKIYKEFMSNLTSEELDKKVLSNLLMVLRDGALGIWQEDITSNLKMAELGASLLPEGWILTHCNTGALATGGYGTALGVIRRAFEVGKRISVLIDETRPYLQGARLTAWELSKLKIPGMIITDNSAGFLMQKGMVQAVIVGADRITLNGDTANKIGTYSLAVLANFHQIPFYVCAPSSTFDLGMSSGKEIPIEERSAEEVLYCTGKRIAPMQAKALNFSFDVTPGSLISAIITEKGIIYPPYEENIKRVLENRL
ncbi:MAG: S-methyl-5-thioribose-1-phosphate isomerase [Caldimicrobium sp.]|nr:S-methyl-5-thioribose-1-phosphate isomerase [Caldimicrobium sp.]MCX7612654.1 S-methyl-5-thioribose-1-phosphate isomerase [Caldimicrobium sp.]MDW8182193.1 S-methyl-5-thioribose-1-phosphate isomerase [Caldimicrobium sp.]